jgi:hypothetical protein
MLRRRGSSKDDLAALHARWLRGVARRGTVLSPNRLRELERQLARLRSKGITTVPQLLRRFRKLSPRLRLGVARDVIGLYEIHQAWPLLMEQLSNPSVRVGYADVLSRLNTKGRATAYFLEAGRRELASPEPDRDWLWAVILGLGGTSDRRAAELLVEIFERSDLPGWVRGEAGDKVGWCNRVRDRRTELYRRSRAAALRGLGDDSIDVQFWSMYVIGTLATGPRCDGKNRHDFNEAIPKLRLIAKHDHRLAPGCWWPMSAEAVDVIACIERGQWPEPEAAERCPYRGARGESQRN